MQIMKVSVKWWVVWLFSTVVLLLCIAGIDDPFTLGEIAISIALGYVLTQIFYNISGYFRHQFRKMSDSTYRKAAQKKGPSSRHRFLVFPFQVREERR
jgi:hypothetical protein